MNNLKFSSLEELNNFIPECPVCQSSLRHSIFSSLVKIENRSIKYTNLLSLIRLKKWIDYEKSLRLDVFCTNCNFQYFASIYIEKPKVFSSIKISNIYLYNGFYNINQNVSLRLIINYYYNTIKVLKSCSNYSEKLLLIKSFDNKQDMLSDIKKMTSPNYFDKILLLSDH